MVSRTIKNPTIKRLYNFSGNQCAFPNCNEELVTSNGTIVSEMCHIEGLKPNSPRHNLQLPDEQVNGYSNLIVLCQKHHTIIDHDESTYTIEILKKMKQKHEEKFQNNQYEVSDELIQKIQEFYQRQFNINIGTGNQFVTQSGDINVGITSIEKTRELIQTLYDENFPKLVEIAEQTARKNIKKFEDKFVKTISSKLKPGELQILSKPDLQYILTQSVIEAGRKDSDELREHLSNLITLRIQNDADELLSIVYDEAIQTIGKLTINQLKIITICLLLRYTTQNNLKSLSGLEEYLQKYVKPFFDFNNSYPDVVCSIATMGTLLTIGLL